MPFTAALFAYEAQKSSVDEATTFELRLEYRNRSLCTKLIGFSFTATQSWERTKNFLHAKLQVSVVSVIALHMNVSHVLKRET